MPGRNDTCKFHQQSVSHDGLRPDNWHQTFGFILGKSPILSWRSGQLSAKFSTSQLRQKQWHPSRAYCVYMSLQTYFVIWLDLIESPGQHCNVWLNTFTSPPSDTAMTVLHNGANFNAVLSGMVGFRNRKLLHTSQSKCCKSFYLPVLMLRPGHSDTFSNRN